MNKIEAPLIYITNDNVYQGIFMAINQRTENVNHKLWLTGRDSGSVSGVQDVISFDLDEIILDTVMGILKITGKDLHVKGINLDKGEVDFQGKVDQMIYSDSKAMKKQSFVGRLFK